MEIQIYHRRQYRGLQGDRGSRQDCGFRRGATVLRDTAEGMEREPGAGPVTSFWAAAVRVSGYVNYTSLILAAYVNNYYTAC